MKYFCALLLLSMEVVVAGGRDSEPNVNSRYTVESIEITGASKYKLSKALLSDLQKLIGQKLDQLALDKLAEGIRNELHARSVSHKVSRGDEPEHVKVTIEVQQRDRKYDLALGKFLYHSSQGWSANVEGAVNIQPHSVVTLGLVSDGDELLERYAGLTARYENKRLETDRLRLRFQFETYHHQWNQATLSALEGSSETAGIYRTRYNLEPVVTVVLARPLTASAGVSFEFFETQFPSARIEAANAVVGGLSYHQQFEDAGDHKHQLEAGYSLRAATRSLESDFVYTRHRWNFGYKIAGPKQSVAVNLSGGVLSGRAPLFERFVLGNSTTLRGWSKFDISPLGGNRMIHNSLEYRYDSFGIFYDVGADWNQGQAVPTRHSVGLGLRDPNFYAFVAFPVKTGRAEPIFMVGASF